MDPIKKARSLEELESLIRRHQKLYYNGEPEISDEAFDALWDELKSLDPESPLIAGVGADSVDGWPKAAHVMPMGSQSKASSPEEFLEWAAKHSGSPFLVQYKLDGASLELQYQAGRLIRAVTRGDGQVGDEITQNALRMRGVPRLLPSPFTGAVRGEVLMSRETHRRKYSDKANCRNAANGLMKRKDGLGAEDLELICYDAKGLLEEGASAGSRLFSDEPGKLAWLSSAGFATVKTERIADAEAVVAYRSTTMDLRPELPYDIDGLVVKMPELDEEDLAKARPDKQIAFKFDPEEAATLLLDVVWSPSGSIYTPIGVVRPVRLAGTTVQRANLCNPGLIRDMGLRLGSRVVITKRGEIIPKIERLVDNPEDTTPITMPKACSACGSELVDEGSRLYCPNELCPHKELHRLEKWVGILDIRGFGAILVERLHASGLVRRPADLYTLDEEKLLGMERMGKVLAGKLIANLLRPRVLGLAEFLAAFDIEGVGMIVADKLVRGGFDSLEKLFSARPESLSALDGIGEIMAGAIVEGLSELKSQMEDLLALGIVSIAPPNSDREPGSGLPPGPGSALAGKSFCFTGEMSTMKRSEAESLLRSRGATAKPSVTADLDYLVTNDPGSGSAKNLKARALGIAVITEQEFRALAGI